MEGYRLVHTLAEGATGSTLLVEEKSSGEKCVIKRVECSDYTQAMQAYNEALQLERLGSQHSLWSYRQFFVHWDEEAHAIYLCIVSDYYEQGDLTSVITQQRERGEPLEEQLIRKWVGQMVEALCHAHQQNLLHRNLKPTNIFLTSDSSLVLGDFAVPVAMENMRTVTEKRGGTLRWLPPEQLTRGRDGEQGASEKSDVWSMGCVLLELVTCGYLDGSQYSVMMQQFLSDPGVLDRVLQKAGKFYSTELCQLLESCLRRSVEQRSSVRDLVKLPAVQKCLALSNSPLHTSPDSQDYGPAAEKGRVDEIIASMEAIPTETHHLRCLQQLLELTQSGDLIFGQQTVQKVLYSMLSFTSSSSLQLLGCQLLDHFSTESAGSLSTDCVLPLCHALRSHPTSTDVVRTASAVLTKLAARGEDTVGVLKEVGGVQDVLRAMRSRPGDREIVINCCSLLWTFALTDDGCSELAGEGAVKLLCQTLSTHLEDSCLCNAFCSLLWSLSLHEQCRLEMAKYGVLDTLLKSLHTHPEDAEIIKYACRALTSLAGSHEVLALHLIQSESGLEGVSIILRAVECSGRDEETTLAIARLLQSLTGYDDIREELQFLGAVEVLSQLQTELQSFQGERCTRH